MSTVEKRYFSSNSRGRGEEVWKEEGSPFSLTRLEIYDSHPLS